MFPRILILIGLVAASGHGVPPRPTEFLLGGDVSMVQRIEEAGGRFGDGGKPGDVISILSAHGANCFRLRLFVNPDRKDDGVVNDVPYTLALAKRIKKTGARFLLDFHYSDTWADPGKQFTPEAWRGLGFDDLEKQVAEYTRDVIAQFKAEGVLPDIVQVGNEVTPGMLWPEGKLSGNAAEPWKRFSALLKAGIRGVKSALGPDDRVKILIHVDCGGNEATTQWYFDHLQEHGVPFDMIGLSYYPWWHGGLDALAKNLRLTSRRFEKDILVVETAYPWRDPGFWSRKTNMNWPISREGQAEFLKQLVKTVRETPDGRGVGVIYWYPEAIAMPNLRVWNGGSTALFDEKGDALPGVDAMRLR